MELSSKYNPAYTEDRLYKHWEESGYFKSTPDEREPFTIVIPPPNVTGVLHMGHMLNNTIQDILIRKARLDGKNACWVPGTDHASIATEAKVVRWLRDEKQLRKADLTREEFMEYAYQWKDKYGGIILQQLRKLGASCDWDRTAFTMDPGYYDDVLRVFVDLHSKGKLYRGLRMVNWDPEAKTVLSNEEVIYFEENSDLFHIRYEVEGEPGQSVTIATQRPETIFADVAVAVHPDDPRYAHLKGKKVLIPLINRAIPVIFDEYVDIEFGTGALKITPAHDPNDYEIGQKHNLEVIDTIDNGGAINENCTYAPIVGMDRFKARKAMKPALEESGNLVKLESYVTKIGRSERTNSVVEPKLSLQWFVKMGDLGAPALKAVQEGEVQFFPENMQNSYRNWMENLRDWCISRQLWWGQRIPAWYLNTEEIGQEKEAFVALTEAEALEKAREKTGNPSLQASDLRQEEDVLDTWASSWLWPISVFNGIAEPEGEIKYYYPTNVIVTGWDIMFFWVARMIMAGYEYKNERPFQAVYFTGMVRDKQRRKMSKSLGNSPDALKLIEDFGADGVRYGLLSSSPAGGDLLFDEKLCENGRNFCNKMWNALRLIKGWERVPRVKDTETMHKNALAMAWIKEKFDETLTEVEDHFKTYRLSDALMSLYSFLWNDLFAWYLEAIKPPYGDPIDQKTYNFTIDMFAQAMVALHPFMPFVTEEIWQNLEERKEGEVCMLQAYPRKGRVNAELIKNVELAQTITSSLRDIRNQNNMSPKAPLKVYVQQSETIKTLFALEGWKETVVKMGILEVFEVITSEMENTKSFIAGIDKFFVELDLEIDVEAELEKLNTELKRQQGFAMGIEKKLSNERFVAGAPEAVVANERQKLADANERIRILQESIKNLS